MKGEYFSIQQKNFCLHLLNVFVNLGHAYFRGTVCKPSKLQAPTEYAGVMSAIGERLLLLHDIH